MTVASARGDPMITVTERAATVLEAMRTETGARRARA